MTHHNPFEKSIAVFIIALVISLPLYSANALAAIQITKNQGQREIPNYVDSNGDTWLLEARITGADGEVLPEDVKLSIGPQEWDFHECTQTALGVDCRYTTPFRAQANSYAFQVRHGNDVAQGTIIADGAAPIIAFQGQHFWQEGSEVKMHFTVTDPQQGRQNKCVGLATVEIFDTETNQIYFSAPEFEAEQCAFTFEGALPQTFSGERMVKVRVRTADRLGHETLSRQQSLAIDFVVPQIVPESIQLTDATPFVGPQAFTTRIEADIVESTSLSRVIAKSEQTDLGAEGKQADQCVEGEENKWHCIWNGVNVRSEESVSLVIEASDAAGNTATATKGFSFFRDTTAPVIEEFRSLRTFNGESYVKSGENTIVLIVSDQGAGIKQEHIEANLIAIGGERGATPTCTELGAGRWQCVWTARRNFDAGTRSVEISLNQLKDKVGNSIEHSQQLNMIVDTIAPVVDSLSFSSISGTGINPFFQIGDTLKIDADITDASGVFVKVNLLNIVQDAELQFPAGESNEAGWMIFTESSCQRNPEKEQQWKCELTIPQPLKETFLEQASVTLEVEDTPGNEVITWPEAQNVQQVNQNTGEYTFELLGREEITNPDFWKLEEADMGNNFIDISSTKLARMRMPVSVILKPKENSNLLKPLRVQLTGCTEASDSPPLQRELMYGGINNDKIESTIVLEFQQFDGESFFNIAEHPETTRYLRNYTCQMNIFTRIGDNVVSVPEQQDIEFKVPFGLSPLGAQDDALKEKIKEAKEVALHDAWAWTNEVQYFLDVVRTIKTIVDVVISVIKIIDIINIALEPAQKVPPAYQAVTGFCLGGKTAQGIAAEVNGKLEMVVGVLTCSGSIPVVGKVQQNVLDAYNYYVGIASGESGGIAYEVGATGYVANPMRVRSLNDNIVVAGIGLCIPGIIYNLDKLRQIQCQYAMCLENEVAQGVPVAACDAVKDKLICKYVVGDLLEVMPYLRGLDVWLNVIKEALSDWLGTLLTGGIYICATQCPTSTAWAGTCTMLTAVRELVNGANAIDFALEQKKAIGTSYCDTLEAQEEKE